MDYDPYIREPAIGRWWCFCCLHDLYEIDSPEVIAEVQSCRGYSRVRVWDTKEDALKELLAEEEES